MERSVLCQDRGLERQAVFVHSQIFREPAYGSNHPLGIARVEVVADLCEILGWLPHGWIEAAAADADTLALFHDRAYIDALAETDRSGYVCDAARRLHNLGTLENPVFKGVFARAATAVGGSILAAQQALGGVLAFHPAGGTHHAKPSAASGFCYFNDPVFAILTLLNGGIERVVYVDLDAHHGDGVEDAFAPDSRVYTISLHEAGRWPGSGQAGNRREGRARNLPVPAGFNDCEFDLLMEGAVFELVQRWRPEAMVITAGADCLAGDPLSKLALSNGKVCEAIAKLCTLAPRVVVLGGGGYNPWTLARFWTGLWGRFCERDLRLALPDPARAILAALSCDLVDEEDFVPEWLTTLIDAPNPGAIRPSILALRDEVLAA